MVISALERSSCSEVKISARLRALHARKTLHYIHFLGCNETDKGSAELTFSSTHFVWGPSFSIHQSGPKDAVNGKQDGKWIILITRLPKTPWFGKFRCRFHLHIYLLWENLHLRPGWIHMHSGRWKDLFTTNCCAKHQSYILALDLTSLEFNTFYSIDFFQNSI